MGIFENGNWDKMIVTRSELRPSSCELNIEPILSLCGKKRERTERGVG